MHGPRVVILAKSLGSGKSRLERVLGPFGRRALMIGLLRRSFAVAVEYTGGANCTVVSHCDAVLELAESLGMRTWRHSGEGGLNGAANDALHALRLQGASSLLFMATDMPQLRVADLRAVAETGAGNGCAVIGADRHGSGTNLLFVPAGAGMCLSYGPGSLHRHLEEGRRATGQALIYRSAQVGFDIDTPEDLREWRWSWGPVNPPSRPARRARFTLSAAPGR